jgi:predicted RNA binding protein YcfA (HicA-like mRNA interferase family)
MAPDSRDALRRIARHPHNVKEADLERALRRAGWSRGEGGNHEVWTKGAAMVTVPRARKKNPNTVRAIARDALAADRGGGD